MGPFSGMKTCHFQSFLHRTQKWNMSVNVSDKTSLPASRTSREDTAANCHGRVLSGSAQDSASRKRSVFRAPRSCHQNPDSVLPLSGVCPMFSKVTMKSRFSDAPFFFFFPLCVEGYCFLYPKQPLGGWQDWAERKHRSRLYMLVLSEGAEDVFLAPGRGMSG